jgi:hypothetical protein
MALVRTVNQVIEVACAMERIGKDRALDLFNEAHHYVCSQLPLYPQQQASIALVANQAEYPLSAVSPAFLKVWQAFYYSSSDMTTPQPIYPRNTDTLYYDAGPNWDKTSPGQPYAYYERGFNFGLYPAPSSGSVDGVPYIQIEYSMIPLMTQGDTMPSVETIYPWVYMMCSQAVMENPETPAVQNMANSEAYMKKFEFHMNWLRNFVYGRVPRDKPRASVNVPLIRRA